MPLPDFAPIPFGAPVEQKPSAEVLDRLWHRRSTPAPTLHAPGPTPEEMDLLIRIGFRVPDLGKLGPWRIVRFTPEPKTALVERLTAFAEARDDRKAVAADVLEDLAAKSEGEPFRAWCMGCHTPQALLSGKTKTDGPSKLFDQNGASLIADLRNYAHNLDEGTGCLFCHRVDKVEDAGGLKELKLSAKDAEKQFCGEKVVKDIFEVGKP